MERIEEHFASCLKKKKLLKVTPDLTQTKSHIEKARRNLEATGYLNQGFFYDWVVITGYYAMYHASLALLSLAGYDGKDHQCVVTALKKLYVDGSEMERKHIKNLDQANRISESLVEGLDRARRQRISVQYGVIKVYSQDAEWIISTASEFVDRAEELVHTKEGMKLERLRGS